MSRTTVGNSVVVMGGSRLLRSSHDKLGLECCSYNSAVRFCVLSYYEMDWEETQPLSLSHTIYLYIYETDAGQGSGGQQLGVIVCLRAAIRSVTMIKSGSKALSVGNGRCWWISIGRQSRDIAQGSDVPGH